MTSGVRYGFLFLTVAVCGGYGLGHEASGDRLGLSR